MCWGPHGVPRLKTGLEIPYASTQHTQVHILDLPGTQSSLGSRRHTPRQWVGVPHTRPPIPRYPPRTPAESQGRRLARQKSLPPSVSGLKSPEKTRFRQSFPCETTSRTLNRGRTSSVSGSIGPCAGLLNSQDTHHVRDTLVCHPYVQRFEI